MSHGILLVEDDPNLRLVLHDNLEDEGYRVDMAGKGTEALLRALGKSYDLLILDIMLPDQDGYAVCRRLRDEGFTGRVLMLTARTLEEDIVRGFEAGADDYLAKPYRLGELLARVRALLRRPASVPTEALRFGSFALDFARREVRPLGKGEAAATPEAPLPLTRTEFDLLAFLLRNRDRALTRQEILAAVWGEQLVVDPHTVDNFVSSLKRKLGWTSQSAFAIRTLRGVGYRMELLEP